MKITAFLTVFSCLLCLAGETQTTNTFPASGPVGIGTMSPASKLDVVGPVSIGTGSVNTNNTKMFIRNPVGKTWAISSGLNLVNEVDFGIYNWTDNASSPLVNISSTGNVGIGLTNPGMKLDVNGDIRSSRLSSGILSPFLLDNFTYDSKTTYNYGLSWMSDSWFSGGSTSWLSGWGGVKLFTSATPRLSITNVGNVGIGTTNPQSLLAVKGTITAQKVVVTQTGWSDYVFDSSYQLLSLPTVENFIQANKHLPDVPSAQQMQTDGNDLADNQRIMLQKIEELTLYLIEQNKTIAEQNRKIETQEAGMQTMLKDIEPLKAKLDKLSHKKK